MNGPSLSRLGNLRQISQGIETRRIPQGIHNIDRWGIELNELNSNNPQREGYQRIHNVGGRSPDQQVLFPKHEFYENFQNAQDRKTTNFLLFVIIGLLGYKIFIGDDR